MVMTRDTAHFETSLLNSDAPSNAVSIIQITIIEKEKKKIGKKISDIVVTTKERTIH